MTPDVRKALKAVLGIVAAFAVFVVAVTLFSRDDGYTVKLAMDDAAGLRDGSPVSIGGVRVG
ncbi:MAG: hypothetical protein JWM93_1707 [Frankiales bacterium]|nr:hypothetical protein [Frankiales bacterium]